MSGEFRPEQNVAIEATDDEALAKQHGLTEWNEARGQWVAPPQPSDAGHRDGWAEPAHEDYDAERVAQAEGSASQEQGAGENDEAQQQAETQNTEESETEATSAAHIRRRR